MKARVGTFATNKFTNAIQQSTISLTWFRSGVGDPPKINVIPSVAEAGLDCRVVPGISRDAWIADVKRRLGDPSLKVELISESDDPVVSSRDTALYRNLESAIKRLHPDAVVTPILVPYGTDSNAFRPKGVKSYGIFPAILSAETVASMHECAWVLRSLRRPFVSARRQHHVTAVWRHSHLMRVDTSIHRRLPHLFSRREVLVDVVHPQRTGVVERHEDVL